MKKNTNKNKIIKLLHQSGSMTRQDVAKQLKISMPTALQVTNELIEEEILLESGELDSTGGRKAKCLSLNPLVGFSLGVEIGIHYVTLLLLGFDGEAMGEKRIPAEFQDERSWYLKLQEWIFEFLKESECEESKLIGCCISFPGIVNEEKGLITHSHIFGIENMETNLFNQIVSCPVMIVNDANCAAFSESKNFGKTYCYLSLNESVGGAVIRDQNIFYGDTRQAGEIGHMILHPNGKTCYCGKKGCADAYLKPSEFGETKQEKEKYLENLAILLTNLRMLMNVDLVIGGEVGKEFEPYLEKLKNKMAKYDLFSRDLDYVSVRHVKRRACAMGAAMLALEKFGPEAVL